MSEKRFTWETEKLQHLDDEVIIVVDTANKEWKGHILNIVDKLNEQQATINKLKEAIKIAYEEKPFPRIEDIQAKFKELNDDN